MATDGLKMRNIGISAHIDSGKTTLTERILYYCNKIHAIHEVKGKDGVGATMDFMELERERGITIVSAATNVEWDKHSVNIIDTPGHVDFTIEVERALRVLDGAILVLCAVGGVQSQSITVDRQLRRYKVPAIAFINKCDRTGANPERVKNDLCSKLGRNAVLMQLPIGLEDKFDGIIDLVTMKAMYFDGPHGDDLRFGEIPEHLVEKAKITREELVDAASMFSDELAEAFLEGKETPEQIYTAVRKGTLSREMTPVFLGTAYKNKGIQPLLDSVVRYLPAPEDRHNQAIDIDTQENVDLLPDNEKPTVAIGFKLEEGQYGQLTYIRVYQGSIKKGDELTNTRSKRRFKVGRLIRMHANTMEDIDYAPSGDIVALFGVDCASGDTFTQDGLNYSMTSMFVPEPVISLAISPKNKQSADAMSKALNRFAKEDPTFRTFVDPESKETIIRGMGELHLDIYIERMKREYKVELDIGMPQVAYREAITRTGEAEGRFEHAIGGRGLFAHVKMRVEPAEAKSGVSFRNHASVRSVPREFALAVERGARTAMA
ncbi:MAG TPA: elongation factor G, partial [Chitinivibrionales bacterium]